MENEYFRSLLKNDEWNKREHNHMNSIQELEMKVSKIVEKLNKMDEKNSNIKSQQR